MTNRIASVFLSGAGLHRENLCSYTHWNAALPSPAGGRRGGFHRDGVAVPPRRAAASGRGGARLS